MSHWIARAAALAALGLGGTSWGAVLFSDDFSGAGAALNGTTPDVTIGGEVWEAGGAFLDSGQVDAVVGSATGQAAHLDVAFQSGAVNGGTYTATATVTNPNPDWIGFGFMANDVIVGAGGWTQTQFYMRHSNHGQGTGGNGQGAYAWALVRNNTAAAQNDIQLFNGENTGGNFFNIDPLPTASVTLQIVLNTVGPTWTAAYFVNGVQQGTTQNLPASAITELGGVGFSRTSNTTATTGGTIDDFSLQFVQVPEPAALGALALTPALLLRRQRRPLQA